jgi:hypothetical protein
MATGPAKVPVHGARSMPWCARSPAAGVALAGLTFRCLPGGEQTGLSGVLVSISKRNTWPCLTFITLSALSPSLRTPPRSTSRPPSPQPRRRPPAASSTSPSSSRALLRVLLCSPEPAPPAAGPRPFCAALFAAHAIGRAGFRASISLLHHSAAALHHRILCSAAIATIATTTTTTRSPHPLFWSCLFLPGRPTLTILLAAVLLASLPDSPPTTTTLVYAVLTASRLHLPHI